MGASASGRALPANREENAMSEIIFENYVGNVRANSQTAAVLAARLEKAAPDDLTPEQKKALRNVLSCAREVQRVQSDRDRLAPTKLRPVLDSFTNDWSAFYEAMSALGRLPSTVTKNGPIAAKLVQTIFPEGVSFTKLPADRAWSEGDRRLDHIRTGDLAEPITELVGPHFLQGVMRSTEALANAIGTGRNANPVASPTALAESLAQFGRAVGTYGRLLVATVDQDDDASVARFMGAVAPIDHHRATSISRGKGELEEPTDPVDPVIVAPTPTPVVSPTPSPTPSPANPNVEPVS